MKIIREEMFVTKLVLSGKKEIPEHLEREVARGLSEAADMMLAYGVAGVLCSFGEEQGGSNSRLTPKLQNVDLFITESAT